MTALVSFALTMAHADVGRVLERSGAVVKRAGTPEDCATCSTTAAPANGQISSNIGECLDQVCPNRKNSYARIINEFVANSAEPNAAYEAKFGKTVDKLLRDEAIAMNLSDQRSLELIQRAPKIEDPAAIRIFNFARGVQYADKVTSRKSPSGATVVDFEASREVLKDFDGPQLTTSVAAIEHLYKLGEAAPFESDDPVQLRAFHTEAETFAKIKTVLAEMKERRADMERDPEFDFLTKNPTLWSSSDPARLAQLFESGSLESDSLSRLNSSYVVLKAVQDLKSDPEFRKQMTSTPIEIRAFARAGDLRAKLKARLRSRLATLKTPVMPGADVCRTAYESAHVILPSKADAEKARPAVDGLKDAFLNSVSSLVCPADRADLMKHGADWRPVFARDPGDFEKQLSNNLNLAKVSQDQAKSDEETFRKSEKYDALALIDLARVDSDTDSDIASRCRDIAPSYFPDGTNYDFNGFVVGPAVFRDVEKNQGVTYHELGHKLWGELARGGSKCPGREAWFKGVRECLRRNHHELRPEDEAYDESLARAGRPTRFEEEDWADLVSARVDGKSNNFACLFPKAMDESSLKNLSLRAPGTDGHSSTLYRILHQEFLKRGQLPQACRDAVIERGEKLEFQNCLNIRVKTAEGAPH